MTNDEKKAFGVELALVAEAFGEALSPTRIEAYFLALAEYDLGAVRAALRQTIKTHKFFPKPAEIREVIEGGGTEDRSVLAWSRFLRAVERVGTYQSVDFGDPVLHATVEAMGGWTEQWKLERMDERELGYKRAEFVRLYAALSKRGDTLSAPKRLVGQCEASNVARGFLGRDVTLALGPGGDAKALPAARVAALSERSEAPR
jgi:hypothetical protein